VRELILGGARSGKSAFAEAEARGAGLPVVYIATAMVTDPASAGEGLGPEGIAGEGRALGDMEMAARIRRHRERRPADWGLVEEPRRLAASLVARATPGHCLLVDCLTLWLCNLLLAPGAAGEAAFASERAALLDVLPRLPGQILLVSNEVGCGVVPTDPLSRRFVDESGLLHQEVARLCERVVWVAAGLPLYLKGGDQGRP